MKKYQSIILAAFAAGLLVVAGCSLFGTNPSPPTKAESYAFNTQTNYISVPVAVFKTNVITEFTTNQVNISHTNIVTETNFVQVPTYTLTPNDAAKSAATIAGTITNLVAPGVGGFVTNGILGVLALWGTLRSRKNGTVSATLAQEVETLREFIKTLPSGAKYDQAIVSFLQAHQIETGIANQVLGILGKSVDNLEAKSAISEIQKALSAV